MLIRKANSFRHIDIISYLVRYSVHGYDFPGHPQQAPHRGRPVLCDHPRARARRAGGVPQQLWPALQCRPRGSHRLTYTLAQLGYLKRDPKGRFELGLGVLATAYPLLSAIKVRQMARPLMRDFAAYAGGTVSIAMPFGLDFIYVETLRTTDAVPHVPDVGFTGTMATTAVGRALLSLFTKDELTSHLARVKTERPEEADYVEKRTLPDMELCKERGFAVSLGEWRREIFGVAAPLYRTATGDCLSVNCGIPSFRFSAEQIERECGPRILGLARSIRSLVANDRQSPT